MPIAFAGPDLFAVPTPASHSEAIECITDVVMCVSAIRELKALRVGRCSSVDTIVAETGYYPTRDDIQALLDLYGLNGRFAANDIFRAYQNLWVRTDLATSLVGHEIITWDAFQVSPAIPTSVPQHKRALEQTLATVASHTSATATIPVMCASAGTAHVSFEAIRWSDGCTFAAGVRSGAVDVQRNITDVLRAYDPYEIWQAASDVDAVALAVRLRTAQLFNKQLTDVSEVVVGASFLASLDDTQCAGSGRYSKLTLDVCARLIGGVEKIKPFLQVAPTKNGSWTQKVRSRDGALAYRIQMGGGHEALRLMAWKTTKCWELANVGVKKEEEIAD